MPTTQKKCVSDKREKLKTAPRKRAELKITNAPDLLPKELLTKHSERAPPKLEELPMPNLKHAASPNARKVRESNAN